MEKGHFVTLIFLYIFVRNPKRKIKTETKQHYSPSMVETEDDTVAVNLRLLKTNTRSHASSIMLGGRTGRLCQMTKSLRATSTAHMSLGTCIIK